MSYDTLDITNVTTTINYCQGYSVNTPTGDSGFELQPPHYHQCHYQDPYFQDYRVNTPARDSSFLSYESLTTINVPSRIHTFKIIV